MFVRENEMERARTWVKKMDNQELVSQIKMYESIIEFDCFDEFILADEILELWQFMLQESVKRLALTCPMSNRGNVNANMQNLTFEEMLQ